MSKKQFLTNLGYGKNVSPDILEDLNYLSRTYGVTFSKGNMHWTTGQIKINGHNLGRYRVTIGTYPVTDYILERFREAQEFNPAIYKELFNYISISQFFSFKAKSLWKRTRHPHAYRNEHDSICVGSAPCQCIKQSNFIGLFDAMNTVINNVKRLDAFALLGIDSSRSPLPPGVTEDESLDKLLEYCANYHEKCTRCNHNMISGAFKDVVKADLTNAICVRCLQDKK